MRLVRAVLGPAGLRLMKVSGAMVLRVVEVTLGGPQTSLCGPQPVAEVLEWRPT
jgi:hypothetical protein